MCAHIFEQASSDDASIRIEQVPPRRLYKGLLLSICYASTIGGTVTLTGTGPNIVLAGTMDRCAPGVHMRTHIHAACSAVITRSRISIGCCTHSHPLSSVCCSLGHGCRCCSLDSGLSNYSVQRWGVCADVVRHRWTADTSRASSRKSTQNWAQ